jgi:hypothetical protein
MFNNKGMEEMNQNNENFLSYLVDSVKSFIFTQKTFSLDDIKKVSVIFF